MPKPVVQVGDDPDPSEWLFVSLEQKRIDQSKPYDAKKACWVPDEKEGYVLGEIKATKGELVTVGLPGGEVKPIVPLSWDRTKKTVSIEWKRTLWKNLQRIQIRHHLVLGPGWCEPRSDQTDVILKEYGFCLIGSLDHPELVPVQRYTRQKHPYLQHFPQFFSIHVYTSRRKTSKRS